MKTEPIEFKVTPVRKAALEKAAGAHECRSVEGFLDRLLDFHEVERFDVPEQESPCGPSGFQVRVLSEPRKPAPRRIF